MIKTMSLVLTFLMLTGCAGVWNPQFIGSDGAFIQTNREIKIQMTCAKDGATSLTASLTGPFILVEQTTSASLGLGHAEAVIQTKSKNATSFYSNLISAIFAGTGAAAGSGAGPAGAAVGAGVGSALSQGVNGS